MAETLGEHHADALLGAVRGVPLDTGGLVLDQLFCANRSYAYVFHVKANRWHQVGVAANVRHLAMHENQLRVTIDMVRELLWRQFPEWAPLSVAPVQSEGTVNAIFRIGDQLAARFPLQPGDVDATRRWLLSEAGASLELLAHTSFAVPEPVGIGEPGARYPLPWSVRTWVPARRPARRTRPPPLTSHTTSPGSSNKSVASMCAAGISPETVAAATFARTTSGWRSASNRASIYSTFPGYVGYGHDYGNYRGSRPMS